MKATCDQTVQEVIDALTEEERQEWRDFCDEYARKMERWSALGRERRGPRRKRKERRRRQREVVVEVGDLWRAAPSALCELLVFRQISYNAVAKALGES